MWAERYDQLASLVLDEELTPMSVARIFPQLPVLPPSHHVTLSGEPWRADFEPAGSGR